MLVSRLTPGSDPVHKVTIIPRGRALGLTQTLPIDEKHNYSKTYCQATLRRLLGGRAAETVVFSELSTGAGDDIKRATDLARKMVCEWGMSVVLGPMTFGEKTEEIFLGREIAQHRDYSENTAQVIDQEIRQLIEAAMKDVENMMQEHLEDLHTLAKALLEKEILDGSEIEHILQKKEEIPAEAAAPEQA